MEWVWVWTLHVGKELRGREEVVEGALVPALVWMLAGSQQLLSCHAESGEGGKRSWVPAVVWKARLAHSSCSLVMGGTSVTSSCIAANTSARRRARTPSRAPRESSVCLRAVHSSASVAMALDGCQCHSLHAQTAKQTQCGVRQLSLQLKSQRSVLLVAAQLLSCSTAADLY
jgi:hypothetical protein